MFTSPARERHSVLLHARNSSVVVREAESWYAWYNRATSTDHAAQGSARSSGLLPGLYNARPARTRQARPVDRHCGAVARTVGILHSIVVALIVPPLHEQYVCTHAATVGQLDGASKIRLLDGLQLADGGGATSPSKRQTVAAAMSVTAPRAYISTLQMAAVQPDTREVADLSAAK
jgi:hypothetical protein